MIASMEHLQTNRVIVLVDMDCFYCQVEEKIDPQLSGKPIAVVQYNAWKGGGIIAVNYPARDRGVTRHMRGAAAKQKCPDIQLVSVPTSRGKADLTKYREAGQRVAEVLQTFTHLLERASVDEAYLDITEAVNAKIQNESNISVNLLQNTHVVGFEVEDFVENVKTGMMESNLKLCVGGIITEEVRAAVFEKTGYRCSAGVAHNKILAKLACGLHKPNKQTILPQCSVEGLYQNLAVRKIRSLGGKFGEILSDDLGISTMGELVTFTEKELIQRYDEKTGSFLYNIARGIDLEPVTTRLVSKSIGCCKKFPGRTALVTYAAVSHWINELSQEISERLAKDLEENNRKAKQMVVSFSQKINRRDVPSSRTHVLNSYEPERIATDMLGVINRYCIREDGTYHIKYMGISVGKFEENKKKNDISTYFKSGDKNIFKSSTPTKKSSQNSILNFLAKSNCHKSENNEIDIKVNANQSNEEKPSNEMFHSEFQDDSSSDSDKTILFESDLDNVIVNENCTSLDEDFMKNKLETISPTDSEDSISQEIIAVNTPKKEVQEKKSYFDSFFSNIAITPKEIERNFDTSRYLEENDPQSGGDDSSQNSNKTYNSDSNRQSTEINVQTVRETAYNGTNSVNAETSKFSPVLNRKFLFENLNSHNSKERCPDCNKLIRIDEMPEHLDYHFAVKMVREEAHLYTNDSTADMDRKRETKPTSKTHTKFKTASKTASCITKRADGKNKRKNIASSNLLTSFLEIENAKIDGPTEICPQCNKKISSDAFLNHLDYHAAKKLHLELNSASTSTATSNIRKAPPGKQDGNKNSIDSFFIQNL